MIGWHLNSQRACLNLGMKVTPTNGWPGMRNAPQSQVETHHYFGENKEVVEVEECDKALSEETRSMKNANRFVDKVSGAS